MTSYNFKEIGSPVCFLDDAKVMLQHENHSWCLSTLEGRKLFVPEASKERGSLQCACFMNRNTLLVGCNNGLYVYDLSLLYRLFDMTLAQAEECWKVLEKVVDREKAILGLEDTMKLIEQYRLAQDKLQEFWPAIEKILAEESI